MAFLLILIQMGIQSGMSHSYSDIQGMEPNNFQIDSFKYPITKRQVKEIF